MDGGRGLSVWSDTKAIWLLNCDAVLRQLFEPNTTRPVEAYLS
jgi:hypothetical protein